MQKTRTFDALTWINNVRVNYNKDRYSAIMKALESFHEQKYDHLEIMDLVLTNLLKGDVKGLKNVDPIVKEFRLFLSDEHADKLDIMYKVKLMHRARTDLEAALAIANDEERVKVFMGTLIDFFDIYGDLDAEAMVKIRQVITDPLRLPAIVFSSQSKDVLIVPFANFGKTVLARGR